MHFGSIAYQFFAAAAWACVATPTIIEVDRNGRALAKEEAKRQKKFEKDPDRSDAHFVQAPVELCSLPHSALRGDAFMRVRRREPSI